MQKTEIATETGWLEKSVDRNVNTNHETEAESEFVPKIEEDIPASVEALVTSDNDMLLDASDRVAPSTIGLEKPMWRHPFPRALLVLFGVGALGIVISQLTQGNYPSAEKAPPSVASTPTPTNSPSVAGSENGELQSRLATVRLNMKLQNIKEKRVAANKATLSKPATNKPKLTHAPQPSTVTTTEPRQVVIYRTAPTKSNLSPQVQPQRTWEKQQSKLAEPKQAIDPHKEWLAAANIGSYGQISSNSNITSADSETSSLATANANETQSASGGIGLAPERLRNSRSNKVPSSSSHVAGNNNIVGEDNKGEGTLFLNTSPSNFLASNRTTDPQQADVQPSNSTTHLEPTELSLKKAHSLVVGTKAKARLQTPIAWSDEVRNPNQNFLVELSEPLKGSDGEVSIPKGAYLVARVSAAGAGGIIQMSAVSYLSTRNDRTIERPLPQGAILILGKNGQPLQAKVTGNHRGTNVVTVLLSGASAATSLVNQATSQSYLGNGGSFSTTTTSPNPNYVAGFGQGVASELMQQIQQRNQHARQQSESQPNVYILAQNTKVQVFVNDSVSLP
jgi:hypothetical protein